MACEIGVGLGLGSLRVVNGLPGAAFIEDKCVARHRLGKMSRKRCIDLARAVEPGHFDVDSPRIGISTAHEGC